MCGDANGCMLLAEGAPFEINISGSLKKEIEKRLLEGAAADVFLQAQKSIFLLMVEGTFDYFVKSERYCQLKGTTQNSLSLSLSLSLSQIGRAHV